MVFVHARNATVKTALTLREMANNQGDATLFRAEPSPEYGAAEKQVFSKLTMCALVWYFLTVVIQRFFILSTAPFEKKHSYVLSEYFRRHIY